MFSHQIVFDPELIARYDKSGPRYTSYPTAVQFQADFSEIRYRAQVEQTNQVQSPQRLSLYLHLPFCDTVCYYCACNKVVTKNRARAAPYLARLHKEIALQGRLFDPDRLVDQLHWGGGTPTFLAHDEMRELMRVTREHFRLPDDDAGEYSIEIDPRELRPGTLRLLRDLGFNRLSMGVQDFDPTVQRAVNRLQDETVTLTALAEARSLGFRSINLDLIYGLPHQSVDSFARTLDRIVAADPDRLSVFNYAHLPEMFKTQRQINAMDLPDPTVKLSILQYTIERLTTAGYVYIGMDHFARPDDELARAQRDGTLTRNFQGYSTRGERDLIGLGVTAIGKVGTCYSQNQKTLAAYQAELDAGHLPVFRGIELGPDDLLRREVIANLICHFRIDIPTIEARHGVVFREYFAQELSMLLVMQQDGLLVLKEDAIAVRPAGKLLIRNVCMIFDRYLRHDSGQRFSKVI